jgi:rsbT antagonist protein RsbS
MSVAILRHGDYLIATVQSDLSDRQLRDLRDRLSREVGDVRARGVILDVTALDVIDSFAARALRSMTLTVRMRGAETVIVGIRPDVAIAMVQFDLNLDVLRTALDLDEAVEMLDRSTSVERHGG